MILLFVTLPRCGVLESERNFFDNGISSFLFIFLFYVFISSNDLVILLLCVILDSRMHFVMSRVNLWFWPRWSASLLTCAGYLLLRYVFVALMNDLFDACIMYELKYIYILLFENINGIPQGSSISIILFKENIK